MLVKHVKRQKAGAQNAHHCEQSTGRLEKWSPKILETEQMRANERGRAGNGPEKKHKHVSIWHTLFFFATRKQTNKLLIVFSVCYTWKETKRLIDPFYSFLPQKVSQILSLGKKTKKNITNCCLFVYFSHNFRCCSGCYYHFFCFHSLIFIFFVCLF